MKKMICYFLVCTAILALIAGCVSAPTDTTQSATNDSATTVPQETKPEKGSSLVEYDPDRSIYFLCENRYHVYYEGVFGSSNFNFEIISKERLNLDAITISLPSANVYTVEVFEDKIPRSTEFMSKESNTMPLRVYEACYGVDYSDYGSDTFDQQAAAAKEAFQNLTTDDIPMVYCYPVLVYFDFNVPLVDEEITYLDITINGTHYQPTLGCFRIISEKNSPYKLDMGLGFGGGRVWQDWLYNDGLYKFSFGGDMEIKEDMTITGMELLGDQWEVLSLNIWGKIGGMNVNFTWDGKSPIDLYEGDNISVDGVFYNPHLDGISYDILLLAVINAQVNNEAKYFLSKHRIISQTNPYELYAIIFDGVDMEPYYRGYYYKYNELWRKAYLDKIPKE